jgi:DnaJ-class molecular chaperone
LKKFLLDNQDLLHYFQIAELLQTILASKVEMDIKKCFEILELDPHASMDEVKQAYKDIVNVWHPDRFSHNPRLKEKAEKKSKEINVAYAAVKSFLSQKREANPATEAATRDKETKGERKKKARTTSETQDKTELAFEAGTRIFLEVCSYLYSTLRHVVDKQALKAVAETKVGRDRPKRRQHRGDGKDEER